MPTEDWEATGETNGTQYFRKKGPKPDPNIRSGLETIRSAAELEDILADEILRNMPEDQRNRIQDQAREMSDAAWRNTGFDGGYFDPVERCVTKIIKGMGLVRLPPARIGEG